MPNHEPQAGAAALVSAFEQHSARIHGLVLARCGDKPLAEEITAQTFEAAAVLFSRHRGDEVTGAWLSTVALRRLVDHWRTNSRRSRRDVRLRSMAELTMPVEHDRDDAVWAALDSLAPNQRAALTLRYLDDWSVSEIAEGLGFSYQATESLLARGRRSLRQALDGQGVFE